MRHPLRRLGGLVPAIALLGVLTTPVHALTPNGKLQIIHMDAGQGDAALVITPLGQTVLIDEGTNFTAGMSPPSCSKVVAQLQALGVTHVDYHVASHYHADHIGCMTNVIGAGITISNGYDRSGSYGSATFTNYASALGANRHTFIKGQTITLDAAATHPVILKCVDLNGAGISLSSGDSPENSRSVVVTVTYGSFTEELGGDLPGFAVSSDKDIETTVAGYVGQAEVYKAHHHASATGSNDAYLTALHARIGIVSCGTGNAYGHPTSAALGRMHNRGLRTFWTETGTGVSPQAGVDKVANGMITIQATWQAGGVDSVFFSTSGSYTTYAYQDTFTNFGGSQVDNIAPAVTVTSPNGGENWAPGTVHAVTWTASDNVGVTSVDVNYSTDNGANWNPIAAGINNLGVYNWNVPQSPSNQSLVQVVAHDLAANSGVDVSNANFIIPDLVVPTAQVLSPNGGDIFTEGTSTMVSWTSGDNVSVDSVNVDFSEHGTDGPWLAIGHGLAPIDSITWVLPGDSSDSALVRVTAFDHSLNNVFDLSDSLFHIVPAIVGSGGGPSRTLALGHPTPNPSRSAVRIDYGIPASGNVGFDILDVSGRRVWNLEQGTVAAGSHYLSWNGRTNDGGTAPAGLYFVRLRAPSGVRTTKLIRLP